MILFWAIGRHRILAAFVFAVYLLIAIRFWYVALPVLAHRIVCRGLVREGQRDRSRAVIRQILQKTPVPA